ncbi:hypothetical protein Tco_0318385 [Tanacetum coccineum]
MFVLSQVVQIVLWYLDSGCSRHMTGDRARLINFVEKFIGTVRFGNDEYAAIVGYGDYKLGDTIISRVYYVEGLKHNLFSVGQFCDGGLEVAFRQHSCHIRNYDMVIYSTIWMCTISLETKDGENLSSDSEVYCKDSMALNATVSFVRQINGTEFVNQGHSTDGLRSVYFRMKLADGRSALVKDPEPPSVPPTKKQVDDLFHWFDDDEVVPIPSVVPISPVHVPAAPTPRIHVDSDVENCLIIGDSHVFAPTNAPEPIQTASSFQLSNIDVTPTTNYLIVQKWDSSTSA